MRRFTRLTNAFSKKVENHAHALALYFVFYNFMRPHTSLKGKTPAQAAGLAKTALDLRWLVERMDSLAPKSKRGPYKKTGRCLARPTTTTSVSLKFGVVDHAAFFRSLLYPDNGRAGNHPAESVPGPKVYRDPRVVPATIVPCLLEPAAGGDLVFLVGVGIV